MGTQPGTSTFRWILAWAVLLVILGALNRTRVGHATIYYLLVLALLLLLVTQYRWLAQALAPISTVSLTPVAPVQASNGSGAGG